VVLGTYRPVEVVLRAHPLRGMVQELRGRGEAVELQLECLSARDVAAYIAGRLRGPVATSLALVVHARTDGNALFLVNIVEHLVRQGLVIEHEGKWTLRPEAEATVTSLPEGLQQLLLRRVEELKPEVRQMLEAASVMGEEFAVAAVAEGAQSPVEDMEAQCEALAVQHHFLTDAGLAVWPDGTRTGVYRFQHALYHQVLYERLGTARRVQLHRRIGARLEAGYGTRAGEIAAQLAVHFERGSEMHQAVHYWQQAADNATRRKAYHEAVAALRKGLALLAMLPESRERTQSELALQLNLGELVMAVKGMASLEAGEVYTRAHALCQQVGEPRQRFRVLWGLIAVYNGLGRLHTAAELGQQLLDLAQRQHDAVLVQESHVIVGGNALYRGDFVTARAHLEQSLEVSAVPHSTSTLLAGRLHPRITSYAWLLRPLWALGYADQAQRRYQEALTLAQQLEHTPTLALVDYFAAMLSQARRDAAATYARADALMAFAAAQGLGHRVEQGRILRGWALAMQGDAAAGVQQIHQGLAHRDMASKLGRPHRLSLLAEAYGQAGQPEAGLQVLAEALALVAATEERWWEAELHRLQGVLLLQRPQPDVSQAEACFQQALDVARSQQAKALELRAALSLSRLWQQQGQRAAAYALLAPLYGWFTEGFDTADLQEAQARLGSGGQH
jgi:predicted ATPase